MLIRGRGIVAEEVKSYQRPVDTFRELVKLKRQGDDIERRVWFAVVTSRWENGTG